ncbi:nucleotidyl transferase AbiEii/AbiGii toxin family protein [Actinoallomurus sp. NPDC050550]|uniref:nucleotidyl transferase AbiEii/AbiGii toxin family protein n=1 Tax=Actinoallomurus sp. NPDC050550 TaxID=3154937 RepID=UPI0033C8477B
MPPFHRRIIEAGLDLCEAYGLFLAGGYAMRAHGLVDRPSKDIDFATDHPLPVDELTARVVAGYRAKGFAVEAKPGNYRFARLLVSDPQTGEVCEVDLMKASLRVSPIVVDSCPVVGFDDAVGLKMRAVHDRGIARDLIAPRRSPANTASSDSSGSAARMSGTSLCTGWSHGWRRPSSSTTRSSRATG